MSTDHTVIRLHPNDDVVIATGEQMHLHVDTVLAKASPVDAGIRGKLETILKEQAGLPKPREAGRSIGQPH